MVIDPVRFPSELVALLHGQAYIESHDGGHCAASPVRCRPLLCVCSQASRMERSRRGLEAQRARLDQTLIELLSSEASKVHGNVASAGACRRGREQLNSDARFECSQFVALVAVAHSPPASLPNQHHHMRPDRGGAAGVDGPSNKLSHIAAPRKFVQVWLGHRRRSIARRAMRASVIPRPKIENGITFSGLRCCYTA